MPESDQREIIRQLPRDGLRKIRNIQIRNADIEPLLNAGNKLVSTTINAACAKVQEDEESRGNPRWCVFSSWMGPLVEGKVPSGEKFGYGTVEGHIKAAV